MLPEPDGHENAPGTNAPAPGQASPWAAQQPPGPPQAAEGTPTSVLPDPAALPTMAMHDLPSAAPAPAPQQPAPAPFVTPAVSAPAPSAPAGQAFAAAPAPGAPVAPATTSQPMQRRTKRRIVIWLVVVAVLIVAIVAGIVALMSMNKDRDPADTVTDYLALLEDGKAEDAGKLVSPGNGDTSLLTDEVLAASAEKLTVKDVETTERTGDGATVEATLAVGSEQFTQTFEVEHGPKEFLVLDTWRLDQPLTAELEVASDTLDTVTVAGVDVPLKRGSATVTVYPGEYEVTAAGNTYFSANTESVLALPEEADADVDTPYISLTTNDAFEQAVMDQVVQRINDCTAVPTNMDHECPSVTRDKHLESLAVTEAPTGFEYLTEDGFQTETAEITVVRTSGGTDTEGFTVEGDISIGDDGKPTIKNVDTWMDYYE